MSFQKFLMDRPARLQNSLALMAINAADAAITIGTRISAPIAGLLLFIAKTWRNVNVAV